MIQRRYDWPRFWYLRDGETPWIQHGLLSSAYDFKSTLDQKKLLFELRELLDVPCLILLGEPGMGKSHSLGETYKALQNTNKARFRLFDLPEFSSTNELIQSIFTDNQDFIEWKTGDFDLHLFLDSLDEAFIRVRKITERLNRFLEELFEDIKQEIAKPHNIASSSEGDKAIGDAERFEDITKPHKPEVSTESEKVIIEKVQAKLACLRLRIVCRTADWQRLSLFEEQLQKLWGNDAVKVFVLAPLRQRDVLEAANQNNIDADRFWLEVKNKTAEGFCSDPIMLKVLINEFYRTNTLPKTKREIYRKGCLEYCREVNITHAESHKSQPEQRFIIAARIAALTIFTERSGVAWQNMDFVEDALLSIDHCTEDKETIDEHEFYVYERFAYMKH